MGSKDRGRAEPEGAPDQEAHPRLRTETLLRTPRGRRRQAEDTHQIWWNISR